MKVLFAAPENAWGGFLHQIRERLPHCVFVATGGFEVADLKGYDVLIPTMCRVDRKLLESADRLALIQQCGAGLEAVDLRAAHELNIPAANVPTDSSGNAASVAEIGVYLMTGLSRDVRAMERSLAGRRMGEPRGLALAGRTAGIVGMGGIGRALVKRLKAFDMKIMGIRRHDPASAKEELGLDWAGGPGDLYELLSSSDYTLLCVPLNDKTRNLMDDLAFAAMKKSSFLINLARGGLVDRGALERALSSGAIAGAGLDVYWEEPPDPNDPVFNYNVMATPHIGGSTDLSMKGIVEAVAENIERVAKGEEPLNRRYPED